MEIFEGMKAFVYGEFDIEPNVLIDENGSSLQPVGKPVAWFDFSESKNQVVQFKYAISFISAEQAEKNLKKEIQDWDFEKLVESGKEIWEKALGKIQVTGGTKWLDAAVPDTLYRQSGDAWVSFNHCFP